MSLTVADLRPDVDLDQATRHLEQLHHGGEGYVSLVLLANGMRERHCFTATGALELSADPQVIGQSYGELSDVVANHWNVYTACATFVKTPAKGRGNRGDVSSIPGVWCDLDVKPGTEGYFQNETQLAEYVARLPTPTLQVASGSGGRHVYWLTKDRLPAVDGQRLLHAWLDFLRSQGDGAVIENVHDTTRVLRLAGTVRWPKVDDAQESRPAPVVLLSDDGPRYHAAELELMSSLAHGEAQAMRDQMREQRALMDQERRQDLSRRGLDLNVYDHVVRRFNVIEDWARLLEPTGWTLFSDQRDGPARCRYWTRPGKSRADGKSASTDFVSDDGFTSNVMSIYSGDKELADLRENSGDSNAHALVTKWHFALKRLYEDSESSLLRAIADGNGKLP